ncbi:hypothetical protein I7I53_08101 [Histoplasma capsulatum var. duboisii H88]|uniref:Uncharacterized protein n=1 Tax=Ajellomyces capsulatus (strain H88) TaxID=544711 RepID=A0A8A1LHS2_AJEC8|nr:hypothetical protein I7I53_08101 [Histoplasma capsulatum var. duboisii H88]
MERCAFWPCPAVVVAPAMAIQESTNKQGVHLHFIYEGFSGPQRSQSPGLIINYCLSYVTSNSGIFSSFSIVMRIRQPLSHLQLSTGESLQNA